MPCYDDVEPILASWVLSTLGGFRLRLRWEVSCIYVSKLYVPTLWVHVLRYMYSNYAMLHVVKLCGTCRQARVPTIVISNLVV